MTIPTAVLSLVDDLAEMPGAIAVVLGGSRAGGSGDAGSDWDLGLYYRGRIDLAALARRGDVHPPGSWGRLMNGGAWLTCGSERVDVLLRDLDSVEHWTGRAQAGEFEVDALLGYLAGVPTYMLTAELASCLPLRGDVNAVAYPPRLMEAGPPRWRFCRSFSLEYARSLVKRGDRVGAIGQAAKAVMEEGHARLCERGRWVCNEKRLVELAGLRDLHAAFEQIPPDDAALTAWIDRVAAGLAVPATEIVPWTEAGRRVTTTEAS